MKNTVSALMFRLKKSAMFWVLFILAVALPAINALFNNMSYKDFAGDLPISYLFIDMSSLGNNCALMTSVCLAVFLCAEFRAGTVRNALLSNKSRTQLFFSYAVVGLIIALTYTTLWLASSFAFNFALMGKMLTIDTQFWYLIALAYCAALVTLAIVLFFLFATRNLALTIIIPLLITQIGISIITTVLQVLAQDNSWNNSVVAWIPVLNYTLVTPNALVMLVSIFGGGFEITVPADATLAVCLYSVLFTIIAGFVSWSIFRKADLK